MGSTVGGLFRTLECGVSSAFIYSSRIYYKDPLNEKFEKSDFSISILFFLGFQGLAVEYLECVLDS